MLGYLEVQACNMWVRGALCVMAVGNGEVSRGSQVYAGYRLTVILLDQYSFTPVDC